MGKSFKDMIQNSFIDVENINTKEEVLNENEHPDVVLPEPENVAPTEAPKLPAEAEKTMRRLIGFGGIC